MAEKSKTSVTEIAVLCVGAVILLLLLFWYESGKSSPSTTNNSTTNNSPVTQQPDGQTINLNFQSPVTQNINLAGGYENGYIPLFGFLGYAGW